MTAWTGNPILEFSTNNGSTWTKISDHGRDPLSIQIERIESAQRMANGTMRRYVVAKKHTISITWTNIPSVSTTQLANGQPGSWLENFHDTVDGAFYVRLRAGSDRDTSFTGLNGKVLQMLVTDFSKEVVKRGIDFDWWNLDMTLEEV